MTCLRARARRGWLSECLCVQLLLRPTGAVKEGCIKARATPLPPQVHTEEHKCKRSAPQQDAALHRWVGWVLRCCASLEGPNSEDPGSISTPLVRLSHKLRQAPKSTETAPKNQIIRNGIHGDTHLSPHTAIADPKVQDFTHLSGSRPTVPSSRGDAGLANLSNSLRFERRVGYTEAIPADGGRSVDPTTLVANWVEERLDRNHKHGAHQPQAARCGGHSSGD